MRGWQWMCAALVVSAVGLTGCTKGKNPSQVYAEQTAKHAGASYVVSPAPQAVPVQTAPQVNQVTLPAEHGLPPVVMTEMRLPDGSKITSFDAVGKLEPTTKLPCITLAEAKNSYTPADLVAAFPLCMKQNRIQDAGDLFMLAGVYAFYDKQRVADRTAHPAAQHLAAGVSAHLTQEEKEQFKNYMLPMAKGEGDALGKFCDAVRQIGAPTYTPTYMIQFGKDAHMGSSAKPLVEPFDSAAAWALAQDKYLHCPR